MLYDRKTFGIVISRLRTQRGISQVQMARSAGISRGHLNMLESGKKVIRLDTFLGLPNALALSRQICWRVRKMKLINET